MMRLQILYAILHSVVSVSAVRYRIEANRDPGNQPSTSFVSYSIEFSSFPDFAGNASAPNAFSYNLLRNLGEILGTYPYVRVGGNTQDYAQYNASLRTALNGTYNASKSNDYPTTIYIGPSFFESYNTWPGVKFSHGFNLGLGAKTAEGWQTLVDTIPLACKALGKDRLDVWEYGNEPNNYATSAQGHVRPPTWNESSYTWQWLNGTREIRKQIQSHCPEISSCSYLKFMAPSYDIRAGELNATAVWEDGLDKRRDIKTYSVHNYIDGATSPGVTLQHTLMNHTRSTIDVDEQVAGYEQLMATQNDRPPLIFGETNSLYNQGKPGLSNSFGAALWGVDFNLYAASAGFKRVHMHQGTDYRYQSWQPIDTNKTAKGTKAPYYGNIAVAAAMGNLVDDSISVTNIKLQADTEAAYAVYSKSSLKRIVVINLLGYNTTKDGAGVEPLPNPLVRGNRSYTFTLNGLQDGSTVSIQRLMANGSDAITGITFDGWSYNMELDNGRPVRLSNVTVGETLRLLNGEVTLQVPDSSAAIMKFDVKSV